MESVANYQRLLIWFSAGVTSAVAAKIAIDEYRDSPPIDICLIDTGSEHDDNFRFMRDVSAWLGYEIKILKSDKYTDTFDVYRQTGWLVGPAGARCSLELKKAVRRQYENLRTDLQVFGFDADERGRYETFLENNPLTNVYAPLIERGLTKTDCRQILAQAGIDEPITYQLGFKNANCLKTGCVKGGMGYWNHYRKVYPEAFQRMAAMEREIGAAICKTYVGGERIPVYLDELPEGAGNYDSEPAFQCGLFCGIGGK